MRLYHILIIINLYTLFIKSTAIKTIILQINVPAYNYNFSRKEVFQPHLPVRLPCYDLALVTSFTLGRSLRWRTSGTPSFHGLTGGVYKARERIHRIMADIRLLAIPASRIELQTPDPNCDRLYRFAPCHQVLLSVPAIVARVWPRT